MTKIISLVLLSLFLNSCSTKKTIYVSSPGSFMSSEGISKQKPLSIKENIEDNWTLFYDTINGFEYQEGYTYKIEVEVSKKKNTTTNSSNLNYKLVKIIYQEKNKVVAKIQNFTGQWAVSKLIGIDTSPVSPTLKINLDTHRIGGKSGCNSYGATFIINGEQLTIENPVRTKKYCSNMHIENAFFECLAKTASYKILNNELILYTEDGKELLSCTKIE